MRGRRPFDDTSGAFLSPEAALLLDSAKPPCRAPNPDGLIALMRNPLDADHLLRLARQHRLIPLLYWHLSTTCPDAVPSDIMASLHHDFQSQALRNHRLVETLRRVLDLFDAHGISIIPWKGPTLAIMAYGSLLLRPYSDLDLIVPESQIEMAKNVLCDHGYRLMRAMTKRQQARHRRTFHAYTLLPDSGEDVVDLHWRITQHYIPFPIEMDSLWERSQTLDVLGQSVRCLSPEDTLLLLCVHGTVHRWAEIGWVSDIACLVERFPHLDVEYVLTRSRRLNSERMVLLGLCLCRDLLGTMLPDVVQVRIDAVPVVSDLSATVRSRLWHPPETPWQRLAYYGLVAPTLSCLPDRVRFWWRTAGWVFGPRLKGQAKGWYWRWRYHTLRR